MNSLLSLRGKALAALDGVGLLLLRLWVGQEFVLAGYTKLSSGIHAPEWFAGLSFPFPLGLLAADLNWVAAGLGEVVLGSALVLGYCNRLSALGLLFITYVAVYTVHFDLGWAGWNQIESEVGLGFKLPLMLAVMLLALVAQGGGRYSLQACIDHQRAARRSEGWHDRPA